MGTAQQATAVPVGVRTRSDAGEEEVDRAIVWVVQRRKVFFAVAALVFAGVGAGFGGLKQIEATAEERVLRRQSAEVQSASVLANGKSVSRLHGKMAELSSRVGHLERTQADHAELTRMGIELIMTSPAVAQALSNDPNLNARAAKAVAGTSE